MEKKSAESVSDTPSTRPSTTGTNIFSEPSEAKPTENTKDAGIPPAFSDPQKEESSFLERWCITLSVCGCLVGFGNIRSFPFNALEHGGGYFVFFHIIFSLLVGIPLLFFEFLIGQLTGVGITLVYGRYCKLANGIGLAFFMICLILPAFDQNTGSDTPAMAVRVLFDTAINKSPMMFCENKWNTPDCVSLYESEMHRNCSVRGEFYYQGACGSYKHSTIYTEDSVQQYLDYFNNEQTQKFDLYHQITPLIVFVLPMILILFKPKFIFIAFGISSLLFFTLLIAFCGQSTMSVFKGSDSPNFAGWTYFKHRSHPTRFFNIKSICFCVTEAMYSLALLGTLGSVGSFLRPKDNTFKIVGIAVLADILCSLMCLWIFINSISFMDKMSPESGYFFNDWNKQRYTAVVLPQTTAIAWNSHVWVGVLAVVKILASFNQIFTVCISGAAAIRDLGSKFSSPKAGKSIMFAILLAIQLSLIVLTSQPSAQSFVTAFALRIPVHFFCSRFLYFIGIKACIHVYGKVDFLVDLSHIFPLREGWRRIFSPIGPIMFFAWDYLVPLSMLLSQVWIILYVYVDMQSMSTATVLQSFLVTLIIFSIPFTYAIYALLTYYTKGQSLRLAYQPSTDHPSYKRITGKQTVSKSKSTSMPLASAKTLG